jgi:hypothetical protein
MTSLQPRVLELWSKFKTVKVGASIDGIGNVLEYQRHPAKWRIVKRNIETVDKLPENIHAWLTCTVTTVNVFHIPEFIKWKIMESGLKKFNNGKKLPVLTIHVAHSPSHACIKVLPPEMKELVKQKYNEFKKCLVDENIDEKYVKASIKILDSITGYMMSDNEKDGWSWFREYTRILDLRRGQNILDIAPEYAPYFTDGPADEKTSIARIDRNIQERQNERERIKT